MALSRIVTLGEARSLELLVETFNLLNNFNWGNPVVNLASGRSGVFRRRPVLRASCNSESSLASNLRAPAHTNAAPDKNGEIWGGGLLSGPYCRINPNTERWTGYVLSEPRARSTACHDLVCGP